MAVRSKNTKMVSPVFSEVTKKTAKAATPKAASTTKT